MVFIGVEKELNEWEANGPEGVWDLVALHYKYNNMILEL